MIVLAKLGMVFGELILFTGMFSGIVYVIIKIWDKEEDKANNKSRRLYGIQDDAKIKNIYKDKEYEYNVYRVIEKIINDNKLHIGLIKDNIIVSKKQDGGYDLLMICDNKYRSTLWVRVYPINREPDKIKIELIHDNTKIEVDKRELRLYKKSDKLDEIMEYILDYIENGEDAKGNDYKVPTDSIIST